MIDLWLLPSLSTDVLSHALESQRFWLQAEQVACVENLLCCNLTQSRHCPALGCSPLDFRGREARC